MCAYGGFLLVLKNEGWILIYETSLIKWSNPLNFWYSMNLLIQYPEKVKNWMKIINLSNFTI